MEKLTPAKFVEAKREKLLDYKIYSENFDEASETINEVRAQLQLSAIELERVPLSAFLHATAGLAWEATKHLANTYSAGHAISDLRSMYPTVVESWVRGNAAVNRYPSKTHGAVASVLASGEIYWMFISKCSLIRNKMSEPV